MKDLIEFPEFIELTNKLDVQMGLVLEVERIPKSDKMLKMKVAFDDEERTVVTNIGGQFVDASILVDCMFPFIMNVKPSKIMGVESTAVIMPVVTKEDDLIFLPPKGEIYPKGGRLL